MGVWFWGGVGGVRRVGGRGVETVLRQNVIAQKEFGPGACVRGAKDELAGGPDPGFEGGAVAGEHEFEELGYRGGVLEDLLPRGRVEYREAGVDVPFVGVDAQGDVDLDVLDAAGPTRDFPGELAVGMPGGAHAGVRVSG